MLRTVWSSNPTSPKLLQVYRLWDDMEKRAPFSIFVGHIDGPPEIWYSMVKLDAEVKSEIFE